MFANPDADFERFAAGLVRSYWSTVKSEAFSMPPNEPVEESLDELLSSVSYKIEQCIDGNFQLLMTGEAGDWWRFGFTRRGRAWEMTSASAKSDNTNSPHDLMNGVYAPHFRPFLRHVTDQANDGSEGHQDDHRISL